MKIIAKTGDATFLLEATADEIDRLAGKKIGNNGPSDYSWIRHINFGLEFDIIPAFDSLYRNSQRKKQVDSLRATLNAIIVGLDMIEPLIEEPKPEDREVEVKA